MNVISIGGLKGLFSFLDLLFAFSPANQLKREYHEIGVAIYKGYQTNIPRDFHRSVICFGNRKCFEYVIFSIVLCLFIVVDRRVFDLFNASQKRTQC